MRGQFLTLAETRSNVRARTGYFDLLRAAALLRVITYHTLGWPWLHIVIPAMGVMFALAGSLMAGSLTRRTASSVVISRARRLLPPVWVFGILAIAVGWITLGSGGHNWFRLLFWLLPLRDPEFHSTRLGFVDTLWYVRTYLWFVILSPALLAGFRKAPMVTLIAPLALLPAVSLIPHDKWVGHGAIVDLFGFGTCWILGFAEHDGLLRRLAPALFGALAAILSSIGIALILIFPDDISSHASLNFVGYALWSSAFVLILMRWRPDTTWLKRISWLRRLVSIINARAVTIYIWHDAAIAVTAMLVRMTRWPVSHLAQLPVVLIFTSVASIAFGWVEDVAARRRPALLPASS